MTIRVAINHNTYYTFDKPINLSPHVIRLRPAPHSRTHIHAYSLKVEPKNHFINWQQDAFGNFLARLVFPEKTTKFSVEVEVLADMKVINPFDFFVEEYAENYPFEYEESLKQELLPYLDKVDNGILFDELVASIPVEEQTINDFLVAVNQLLEQKISYAIRMEPGVQTPDQTLSLAKGSCRDTGWLLVQLFRHLGIAARFASGYLVQLKPDEKPLDGPAGAEEDFTDLHAWCEVYIPGAGWIGLDPTSGLFAGEGHIPLACTPAPMSAAPISGYTDECEVEFEYSNTVTRIHEDPRVTKPYTDKQWRDVLALGEAVDKDLHDMDVRLTMGGEPTFVSIDDMESAQWNTDALGDDKLKLAKSLLLKLRDQFAPQGLLHYGQGKWYPGEEVPRWALGIFWRKDGSPIWQNPKLLARIDADYKHTINTAKRFSDKLADNLGLNKSCFQAAYEDSLHYLIEEQKLPTNIDSIAVNAKTSLDRQRLAKVLQQGFKTPSGFVLPIEWNSVLNQWETSQWNLRRGRINLLPGDSPMGLRLPLDELPEAEENPTIERDHFEARGPLPAPGSFHELVEATDNTDTESRSLIRTSLCIEVRDGKLHVFMPPLYSLENYLVIIEAVEKAAGALKTPVIIEGYEPPKDSRMQKLLVTPDPGVIEVNVHPTDNWADMVSNMEALYEAAKQSRLGTEKFMVDGLHTGTGGGNHITLGGQSPADSPMLRRPDILRSFVTFWQHHPSLSYLFSGTFVGPTSQAPRVDEGRDEMLYEMEIAFQQMHEGLSDQPWLVDRLMRNLLIDITGNTHRAEFCIDKLYSPGSSTGRLGILEFRGFEMPPHQQMALVQALLIRALVARFWKEGYNKPLVRWGTLLHDKYMLPHFIWQDIKEVAADLEANGYPFKAEWLLPFEEFRFPHYGRVKLDDISIELRWAIEPWHVLGEEIGSFGTARYVDSSIERLQVKITGLSEGRYVLACNGRRVPLMNTGRHGEYVAGVRYRAWAPPSALHPTIGVHSPLVFDLIDTWNGRSIGGCSYHVSHPGGRSYDNYPINAHEAESRRVNRFDTTSHSYQQTNVHPRPTSDTDTVRDFFANTAASAMEPPVDEFTGEYPYTLDLRRKPSKI